MALFGTDGARGVANRELTAEVALAIGKSAGAIWQSPARILVGRDTRISSGMLEAGIAAGLSAMGVEVWLVGMLPTPALAYLIKAIGAEGGVMISASHNPPQYNGIKLLDGWGRKWAPDQEALVENGLARAGEWTVGPERIGAIRHLEDDAVARYHHYLIEHFWGAVEPLHVVVDLAHGAAISTAEPVLRRLGLRVSVINGEPEGALINQRCGATHPQTLQHKVVELGADLGFAFDGDADRLIAVDHLGQIVDGDGVLYALAKGMKETQELEGERVVATVMSNLGLERALEREGVQMVRTPVGDRWVAEEMRTAKAVLGGEQSGHIILKRWAETGDGLLTGLAVLREMARSGRRLAELTEPLVRYPQILHNVRVERPLDDWTVIPGLAEQVKCAERELGQDGRVLIRPSGTEPLLRIMVEGSHSGQIEKWTQALAKTVEAALKEPV